MFIMGIASLVICAAGLFLAWRYGMSRLRWWVRLLWLLGLVPGTFAVGLLGFWAASGIAHQAAISGFHQFLNGTVVSADVREITCTRDGPCHYEYSCDPYVVTWTTFDADGNPTVHTETRWRDCPYVTHEYDYTTLDSIGNTHEFGRYISAEPVAWRDSREVPTDLPRGTPGPWQKAHDALDAGRGLPMTIEGEYENYILASDEELLKASSEHIEELLEAGLLPDHTQNLYDPIYDAYNADKVSFVGFTPDDAAEWQEAVMQFNAALGMELRGDLHVVVIEDSVLPSAVSSDNYVNALKAYWLNYFDKYAFGKNGIVVVIGIDDQHETIEWARAATGMPVGNGSMISWLEQTLMNEPFTLDTVMGETYAHVTDGDLSYVYGEGLIPQAMLVDFPFERQCMKCEDDDEGEGLGFTDLTINSQVEPWGYVLTIFLQVLVTGGAWSIFIFYWCQRGSEDYEYYAERAAEERRREELRTLLSRTGPWRVGKRKKLKQQLREMEW